MKITSSGIIRNEEKPRVGITQANRLDPSVFDAIYDGIDLRYEEFLLSLKEDGIEEDSKAWYEATDRYQEEETEYLFGDAWIKNEEGKYVIDDTKDYAAVYSSATGSISVEFSKYTKRCHHTSPCYVMADGSGPCGDLDTEGDSVVAFTLHPDYFQKP